jgi:hypothetical protein
MITPSSLLRDTALGGLVLAVCAVSTDEGAAAGVALGSLSSVTAVASLAWVTRALGTPTFALRLLLQQALFFGLFLALVGMVPPVALLVGHLAFFPAMVLRAAQGAVAALRNPAGLAFASEPG